MLRNWKWFGVALLLACAMAVPGTARAQSDGPLPEPDKGLEKRLDDFEKRLIASLADAFKAVKDDLQTLRKEVNLKDAVATGRITTLEVAVAQLKLDLERARAELESLRASNKQISLYPAEDRLAEMQRQLALLNQTVQSISKYPTTNGQPPVVTTDRGSMVVVNRYPETVTLMVNGVAQGRIAPNTQFIVRDLPAGPFNYSILSSYVETRRVSVIRPGEPLQVNVQ